MTPDDLATTWNYEGHAPGIMVRHDFSCRMWELRAKLLKTLPATPTA